MMQEELKSSLRKIANTIRQLSMEAVQKAHSGHPGLPLGCAELGAYLYGVVMHHNPKNPKWINRDRFVLSAGHGSMLLYSLLHLSGFEVSIEDIKQFRQLHSKTPGHPENLLTPGVETTSGPLGQGVGQAVGMALGMKILETKFNTDEFPIFKNKIYCLAGDGCIMEGVSAETSSLAGHWQLDNLVLIYDSNKVCLDGPLSESSSENVKERYLAYGWDVFEIDGHDLDEIDEVFSEVKREQKRPVLIIAHTIIGKGAASKEGSHEIHGSPLGTEVVAKTKEALGIAHHEEFFVPQSVYAFFEQRMEKQIQGEKDWQKLFQKWSKAHPALFSEFEKMEKKTLPNNLEEILKGIEMKKNLSSREASSLVIQKLGTLLPFFYGGSADLSSSDKTFMKEFLMIAPRDFRGKNIKYGTREFGMGTIVMGLALTGMILPFCGTFLTFSDYMKNAIRMACLSSVQVIYQLTHDSIFLGEDGPTHQPVEHLASLRSIPRLQVIRPADDFEVKMAWVAALSYRGGPTVLILSRQSLPSLEETHVSYEEGLGRGIYIVKKERIKPDYTLFATGSELKLALEVAQRLEHLGKDVRVLSCPSFEIFEKQPLEYRERMVGGDLGRRISIEAASCFGWHRYVGREGTTISVEGFGMSAPASVLAQEYGFTVDTVLERIFQENRKISE